MSRTWTSRLGQQLAKLVNWSEPAGCVDYADRDSERVARELELIKLRFPHHS